MQIVPTLVCRLSVTSLSSQHTLRNSLSMLISWVQDKSCWAAEVHAVGDMFVLFCVLTHDMQGAEQHMPQVQQKPASELIRKAHKLHTSVAAAGTRTDAFLCLLSRRQRIHRARRQQQPPAVCAGIRNRAVRAVQ